MAPGNVFDESYLSNFVATGTKERQPWGEMAAKSCHHLRRQGGPRYTRSQLHLSFCQCRSEPVLAAPRRKSRFADKSRKLSAFRNFRRNDSSTSSCQMTTSSFADPVTAAPRFRLLVAVRNSPAERGSSID